MIGSSKRKFSARTKAVAEAKFNYREAKKFFVDGDAICKASKKALRKAERRQAKKDIAWL